jgi:hypothetical protein
MSIFLNKLFFFYQVLPPALGSGRTIESIFGAGVAGPSRRLFIIKLGPNATKERTGVAGWFFKGPPKRATGNTINCFI